MNLHRFNYVFSWQIFCPRQCECAPQIFVSSAFKCASMIARNFSRKGVCINRGNACRPCYDCISGELHFEDRCRDCCCFKMHRNIRKTFLIAIFPCVVFNDLDFKLWFFYNVCSSEKRFFFHLQDIFANLFHICKSSFTTACDLNFHSNYFATVPILFIALLNLDAWIYVFAYVTLLLTAFALIAILIFHKAYTNLIWRMGKIRLV